MKEPKTAEVKPLKCPSGLGSWREERKSLTYPGGRDPRRIGGDPPLFRHSAEART